MPDNTCMHHRGLCTSSTTVTSQITKPELAVSGIVITYKYSKIIGLRFKNCGDLCHSMSTIVPQRKPVKGVNLVYQELCNMTYKHDVSA